MRVLFLTFVVIASATAQEVPEPIVVGGVDTRLGAASVFPERGVSGEFGTWTVTYAVGAGGIATGGGILVELPDEWFPREHNWVTRPQTKKPRAEAYTRVISSNAGTTLRCVVEGEREGAPIKAARMSLDGRSYRYVFVVRALVTNGSLDEGDTVSMIFGDRSGGGPGFLGPGASSPPLPILMALDHDGDNQFELLRNTPTLEAVAGPATYAQLHAPSNAVLGAPATMRIALLDKLFNPASGPAHFVLSYPDGVTGPDVIEIGPEQRWVSFNVTPILAGVIRVAGRWVERERDLLGNPTEVAAMLPERQLFWGDLHSHTHLSWDGVGRDAFNYARHSSVLDVYAMTDHSQRINPNADWGLDESKWAEYTQANDAHYAPGAFVTLHAYECSFDPPYGHHNVYFRGEPGALRDPQSVTLPQLWQALVAGDALTIPHHTGKFPRPVDLTIHHAELRRNFEMYSGHGLSEAYDPAHPLAVEASDFTSPSFSAKGPVNLQDAWRLGLDVSAIASSDDHMGHPGVAMYGLAAIRATNLTRNDVFQALYDRHTYATTGAKIILHFEVNGVAMGQRAPHQETAAIHIVAHGTDTMEFVEVLRWLPGEDTFRVVQRWEPMVLDFEAAWDDGETAPGAIYYTRLRQPKLIHRRVAMAWSSPVWVE